MMDKILEILSKIRPEFDFTESEKFVTDGMLDSFDIITLVSDLDKEFSVSIDGLDILPENFQSLERIAALVRKNGGDA
ncbi:acyl carrier protein [Thermodesulfobacteriota bacterium]